MYWSDASRTSSSVAGGSKLKSVWMFRHMRPSYGLDRRPPRSYDRGMSVEALGRRLLRLDAAYCAAAGLIALVLAAPLARLFHVPLLLIAAIGSATVVWALVVRRLASSDRWRAPLARVAAANAVAAAGLVALAALSPELGARLLLAAVAVEVAAFAGGQAAA